MDKWHLGYLNTKLFDVKPIIKDWTYDSVAYLQGCKACNEVTKLNDMCKDRQLIGNVYQSLCTCSKCGSYVIFDEHKYRMLDCYLEKNDLTNIK